jgi:hypothetical protein
MQTRQKIGLLIFISFILPLHVAIFFGALDMYLDYALNLAFLSLLVLGSIELETDKRKFRGLILLKIVPIILLVYYLITQIGYPFYNMVLGTSMGEKMSNFFFLNYILNNTPNLYNLMLGIQYGAFFLLVLGFIVFGFSNRKYYGNYMIAFAALYFVDTLFKLINHIALSYNEVYYLLFQYATFMLASISGSYLIFFGQRLRNSYFTQSGIMFFGSIFFRWVFKFVFRIIFQVGLPSLILIIISFIAVVIAGRFIELGSKFRRGIRVFITHAVADYNKYRINELAQFLENQKGIRDVFFCEDDLTGNIDAWMAKTVPQCELLLFITTDKSINSADCATELTLARENGLTVIPILGIGLNWEDLEKLGVHRDIGTEFDPMEFEEFCDKLFQQIQIYNKSLNQPTDSDQPKNT